MELTRTHIQTTEDSVVVVKNGTILTIKKGVGIKPMLEVIDELGENLQGSCVGDRILGKASALLCVYGKVAGVYSPQATKTAIAVLIQAQIPGEADELVPFITNKTKDGICPFEQLLKDIDSAEEAYRILKEKVVI